jgi:RecA-family ATPase
MRQYTNNGFSAEIKEKITQIIESVNGQTENEKRKIFYNEFKKMTYPKTEKFIYLRVWNNEIDNQRKAKAKAKSAVVNAYNQSLLLF